jgi:hypothetical protein
MKLPNPSLEDGFIYFTILANSAKIYLDSCGPGLASG